MKKYLFAFLLLVLFFGSAQAQQPVAVSKTNTKPVYMHIMPWFDGPWTMGAGNWGYHWKMQKMDPNIVDGNGKRQIASHYYPQIGPYDSSDPDVIDYQLLLMKLAGVDGVLIDWYGTAGNVGDIATNLRNSDSIANRTMRSGLKFGLVIEDRFTGGDVNIQTNSMIYVKNNYFTKSNYFRFGSDNAPVVGIFGPDQIQTEAGWTSVFSGAGIADNQIQFLPLEYQGGEAGIHADGEYAWPYQSPGTSDHATQVENFYKSRAPQQKIAMGVVYPGFDDFYAQGENGGVSFFNIPANGIQTLNQMIGLANQYSNDIDIVQLATWNDYGEGTMFEPTQEFGYSLLVRLQQYTGVSYTEDDLKQVTRLFNLRKQYANDASIRTKLDQVYKYMASLQLTEAKALMCTIDNAAGCVITPTVTITSTGSPAEGGGKGTFTITGSNLAANLVVHYTIGGTASSADYTASPALSGSVTLTVAQPSVVITVTPIDDAIYEGDETLIITLSAGSYTFGQSFAQLTIADNDPRPCVAPIIAYTATAPVIDQTVDNVWLKAPVGTLANVTSGSMPSDFAGSKWRAMYDNTYFYVLVEVKDGEKVNDSGTSWWEDDAVEIFIDGDNSKGSSYDGKNDYQIAFRYNDPVAHAGSGAMNVDGVSFAIQNKADGYNLEVKIPWSSIGITPSIGKPIGFDIAVDDDDNGTSRDAQVSAFATNATAYQNPSVFGTVYFTTACAEVVPAPEIISSLAATGNIGEPFSYTITANNNPTTYGAFDLPQGLSINTSTGEISGVPLAGGKSTVRITATNTTGTDTKELIITVNDVITGVGFSGLKPFSALLVPNPVTNGYARIVLSETKDNVLFEVRDVLGQLVYQGNTIDQSEILLNLCGLSQGVYLLRLQVSDLLLTQRFIIE